MMKIQAPYPEMTTGYLTGTLDTDVKKFGKQLWHFTKIVEKENMTSFYHES